MKADLPRDCRRCVHSGHTSCSCDTVDYQASAGDCGGVDWLEAIHGDEFGGSKAQLLRLIALGWGD